MADSTVERDARADRRVRRLTRQIHAFGRAHGGTQAHLEYIGQRGARIVLVGEDGAWGDLVAPTYAIGERAVRGSGATVREEFGAELAAEVRTGPYEWTRMAGIQIGGPANT
ncbi:hypothetical protein [Actinacidiphila yeochonensis]|uniref:hypothetical protein n=1 Tax=Actinacidiphila yeochonensis TaxID=89050 RepID=UPI00056D2605|nr:hypothetical protein [Actinacidiphila yeochonensis]